MKTNIKKEILTMNTDEINELVSVIKLRRKQLGMEAGTNFNVGDKVSFGRPNGLKRIGIIKKVNTAKAVVDVDGQQWRVPFVMMEAA